MCNFIRNFKQFHPSHILFLTIINFDISRDSVLIIRQNLFIYITSILQPHRLFLQHLSFLNLWTDDRLYHLFRNLCLQQISYHISCYLTDPLGSINVKKCQRIKVFYKPCFPFCFLPFFLGIKSRLYHASVVYHS